MSLAKLNHAQVLCMDGHIDLSGRYDGRFFQPVPVKVRSQIENILPAMGGIDDLKSGKNNIRF